MRALQGFFDYLLKLVKLNLHAPDYTLFSKRAKEFKVKLSSKRKSSAIILDASGLKVLGEGEWKVRMQGVDRRRKWIKTHIPLDADS